VTVQASDALPPFAVAGRPGAKQILHTPGLDIAYWRSGDRQGETIVFLHGLGWDGSLWWPFVERYLDRFDVICPDTRGHGDSGKPPGPYSIDAFADDLAALLGGLGISRCTLVGLSQGGMTAQLFAVRHPEQLTRLAVLASTPAVGVATSGNMEARIKAQREQGPEAAARIALRSIFSPAFLDANPEYVERFVAWRSAMNLVAQEAAMRAGAGFDVRDRLPALALPTLVVTGDVDALIPAANGAAIAEFVPGARYASLPGSGHMLAVEKPDELALLLDGFLRD